MIVKDEKGTNAQLGDKIEMIIQLRLVHNGTSKDSILTKSTKTSGNVPPPSYVGDWVEGFTMMSPGDSAVFHVSLDTLQKLQGGMPMPPFIHKGAILQYEVRLLSATPDPQTRAAMEQQKKMMDEQKANGGAMNQQQQQPEANPNQPALDDKLLQDYFVKNNLKPQKTASGLYYIIDKPGSGAPLKAGQTVTVHYTGKNMQGEVFDSNEGSGKPPLDFPLGQHQVIAGWDEGVALAKKGGKIRLFIPSGLAYGPAARSPQIPANSNLIFDVTIDDAK